MKRLFSLLIISLFICTSAIAKYYPEWGKILVQEHTWCKGKGVVVYNNGGRPFEGEPYDYCERKGVSCKISKECKNGHGAKLGPMWQCIELPKRLYHMNGWYMGSFGASKALDMWNKDARTLDSMDMEIHEKHSDYMPVPGDMMFFTFRMSGHVAVVDYIDDSGIHICEQNHSNSIGGKRTFKRDKLPPDCLGWLHSRRNPLKNDTPSEPNNSDAAADSKPWCPQGYKIVMSVQADFDGDGVKETAYAADSTKEYTFEDMFDLPRPVFAITRGGRLLYNTAFSGKPVCDGGPRFTGRLSADDINGDSLPDLIYDEVDCSASSYSDTFCAVGWQNGEFRPLCNEITSVECFLRIFRETKKPAILVSAAFIWGENEAHYDPHKWNLTEYTWQGDMFRKSRSITTKRKYSNGDYLLQELGINPRSKIATKVRIP